jgi:hypothetical protein
MARLASRRTSPAVAFVTYSTMKKAALPLFIGVIVLTGCAHHYVMKLSSGAEITTATKPRLKDGVYHFKDAKGEEHFVPMARVRVVEPASAAAQENQPRPVQSSPVKKRKWYLLWLA